MCVRRPLRARHASLSLGRMRIKPWLKIGYRLAQQNGPGRDNTPGSQWDARSVGERDGTGRVGEIRRTSNVYTTAFCTRSAHAMGFSCLWCVKWKTFIFIGGRRRRRKRKDRESMMLKITYHALEICELVNSREKERSSITALCGESR